MSWVRIDDRFPRHPKIVGLSDAAFRLHVTGLCYCAEHLTDGRITKMAVRLLGANRRQLDELAEAGVWLEDEDAWTVHDFLEYNPSKEKVKREREEAADRRRKWRDGKRNASRDASRTPDATPTPYPTRPDPKGEGRVSEEPSAVAAAPAAESGAATPETKLDEAQVALNVSNASAIRASLRSA